MFYKVVLENQLQECRKSCSEQELTLKLLPIDFVIYEEPFMKLASWPFQFKFLINSSTCPRLNHKEKKLVLEPDLLDSSANLQIYCKAGSFFLLYASKLPPTCRCRISQDVAFKHSEKNVAPIWEMGVVCNFAELPPITNSIHHFSVKTFQLKRL